MTTIASPENRISKIWGRQKIKDVRYRIMSYTVTQPCAQGLLLHNCVTGEMLLLSREEECLLKRLPCEYEPAMDPLIENRFLVPIEHDDKKAVDQLRSILRMMFPQKEIVSYTILPTTGCNARCFYCYQSEMEHVMMSQETASKVASYIASHCGGKKVHIQWFGGEPLVGKHRIGQICAELKAQNIEFRSTMVSNGYLFTDELISQAKNEWNLEKVQITVDGTEAVYNKIKAYPNVTESPYKRVICNVGSLLENGIKVELRMNLGAHNEKDIKVLIRELAEKFENKRDLMPYISLLFDDVGFEPVHQSAEQVTALEQVKAELEDDLQHLGFVAPQKLLAYLQTYHCMADSDAAVVINPNGALSKCEHYIFDQLIGSVDSEERDKALVASWKETVAWDRCHGCALYPTCVMVKKCQAMRPCSRVTQEQKMKRHKSALLALYEYWKNEKCEIDKTADMDIQC